MQTNKTVGFGRQNTHNKSNNINCIPVEYWYGMVLGVEELSAHIFFKKTMENVVIVNGERYRDMVKKFLWFQ